MLSLEYLLISAALAGMLALMLPLTSSAFELSSYAIESANAKSLASQIENCSKKLEIFDTDSECIATALQKNKWTISVQGNLLEITIDNNKINKNLIAIEKTLPEEIEYDSDLFDKFPEQKTQKKISLGLTKKGIINKKTKIEINKIN